MICLVLNNSEMRVGPSRSGGRTWLQTGPSCGDQESLVVNVGLKGAAKIASGVVREGERK